MDAGMFLNIVTLLVSAIAAWLSVVALKEGRKANQLPIVIDLLQRSREPAFARTEEALLSELVTHDPSLGFQCLPEPIKSDAFEVVQYYQCLAYLATHKIADFDLIAPQVSYRAARVWKAIRPHVDGERLIRGGEHTFLNTFELLVREINSVDLQRYDRAAIRRIRRRQLRLWRGRRNN